jgi:hypothetical protein
MYYCTFGRSVPIFSQVEIPMSRVSRALKPSVQGVVREAAEGTPAIT